MRALKKAAALCLVGNMIAVVPEATAAPYESFVAVETEEDLADLLAADLISDETYQTLSELLARGVDLRKAGREELYSLPNLTYEDVDAILGFRGSAGLIRDPADLVPAGVLSEEKLLAIAPFLLIGSETRTRRMRTGGWVRAVTRGTLTDREPPPFAVRARLRTLGAVTAGVAATMTRQRLRDVVYDPNRRALLAEPESLQPHVPKAFVRWESDTLVGIIGTYRLGFGERLTFGNASDYAANGIYLDDQLQFSQELTSDCRRSDAEVEAACDDRNTYVTPDFRWSDALRGVAVGVKDVPVGVGTMQAYAWGSMLPRSIYQYELVDGGACEDARDDEDPACAAPRLYAKPDGPLLTPTDRYSFSTVPDAFLETLAGANLTYFADRRNYAGVTGYGADRKSLIEGIDLDTQEWSRLPPGGRYGAVGGNAALGRGEIDVAAEVTYSFDQLPNGAGAVDGGGGPAAIVRATLSPGRKRELELSGRYYDIDFVNPLARPISAGDEFEGQRARDEAGVRVRYVGEHGKVAVRGMIDAWRTQSQGLFKLSTFAQGDLRLSRDLRGGLRVQYDDKGIGGEGVDCFTVSTEFDERGEEIPCTGSKLSTTARFSAKIDRTLSLSGSVQHRVLDHEAEPGAFRHDVSAWMIAVHRPIKPLRLRARVRYLNEDIADNGYLEQSIWAYADATYAVRPQHRIRGRTDLRVYLDRRTSTMERGQNPELWAWLYYESSF